jgi:16S rRNA (guanine527-N7)-methyltransferase
MTEADARQWIEARWSADRVALLDRYIELLREESERQNLIARSTLDTIWTRHIVDSAQLVPLAQSAASGPWIDIGSGAGLPGIVVAILQPKTVILVEPRRRRAAFLQAVVDALSLDAKVQARSAERLDREQAAVISARAVAALPELFAMGEHLSTASTFWLLPKGRSGDAELVAARQVWNGVFHVEQSLTADDSSIIVARGVQRK